MSFNVHVAFTLACNDKRETQIDNTMRLPIVPRQGDYIFIVEHISVEVMAVVLSEGDIPIVNVAFVEPDNTLQLLPPKDYDDLIMLLKRFGWEEAEYELEGEETNEVIKKKLH